MLTSKPSHLPTAGSQIVLFERVVLTYLPLGAFQESIKTAITLLNREGASQPVAKLFVTNDTPAIYFKSIHRGVKQFVYKMAT